MSTECWVLGLLGPGPEAVFSAGFSSAVETTITRILCAVQALVKRREQRQDKPKEPKRGEPALLALSYSSPCSPVGGSDATLPTY